MVFAVRGWKAAAIPSVLFGRELHFSLLPVILFTASTKYQLDFGCWMCSPVTNGLKSFCAAVDPTERCTGKTGMQEGWHHLGALSTAGPFPATVQCDELR